MESNEKAYGVLAYIGILVLVPLLAGKTEFSRYHANQGLVLFIIDCICGAVFGITFGALGFIPVVGFISKIIGGIIGGLFGLCIFILAIIGIINAVNGEEKPLPIIGGIKLLK